MGTLALGDYQVVFISLQLPEPPAETSATAGATGGYQKSPGPEAPIQAQSAVQASAPIGGATAPPPQPQGRYLKNIIVLLYILQQHS